MQAKIFAADINKNFEILYDAVEVLNSAIIGSTPPGTIVAYAGADAPNGWVLCDGSSYDRQNSNYSALYTSIGGTYGENGNMFNVPDLRGRVVIGYNMMGGSTSTPDTMEGVTTFNTLGKVGGKIDHSLTISQMPRHNHGFTDTYYTWDTMDGTNKLLELGVF